MSSLDNNSDDSVASSHDAMPPPATPRRRGRSVGSNDNLDSPSIPPTPSDSTVVPATPTAATTARHNNNEDDDDGDIPLTPLSALDEPPLVPGEDAAPGAPLNHPWDAHHNNRTHIRGTDIHLETSAAAFNDFLRNFRSLRHSRRQQRQEDDSDDSDLDSLTDDEEEDLPPPLYLTKLQTFVNGWDEARCATLDIDSMHLYYHSVESQKFYHQLVAFPMELIPLMDILVKRQLESMGQTRVNVQVRPFNLKTVSNLRCLDPVAMDSLLSIKGMIVRSSTIIPDLKVAYFCCAICGHGVQVSVDCGRIAEPHDRCPQCNTQAYQMVHNRSVFADKQLVRIQERPDEVPAGQTPASVMTFCFDDLVDSIQPGDRVEVTGVLRAQPVRVHPKISRLKTVYKTYVDVIHFRKITGMEGKKDADLAKHGGKGHWTQARIQELQTLSRTPDIYDKLTTSLAPSIWGLDNIKKGILCMLFGGNHVRVKKGSGQARDDAQENDSWLDEDGGETGGTSKLEKRGDINILLCGDPGTSKSQLLSYVNKLSSRGVYTSGKGSSAVGLTASVVRDPETRDLVLESGALVLSDQGICCIDEFDKMTDSTRSVLHEAMEQQTVSIAKAGIIATLHARTSVLASANPTESRYNPSLSVVENIHLPPTLLSRFDLIYLVLDSPNVDEDRRLAQHLVGLYYETPNVMSPPLDQALLRDYIEYAREHIHPEISDEACDQLLASYLEMRNPGGAVVPNSHRTISATPRQLESLVRLSEALAKMRYSNVVTRADAREAVRLIQVATQAAATDPRTGRIDMDMITTGRSSADRAMGEQVTITLKEIFAGRRGTRMAIRDVSREVSEVTNSSTSHDDLMSVLRIMEADGIIQLNERAQTLFVRTGVIL